MLRELKIDLDTHCSLIDTPIVHRIKFDTTSIYLTDSTFYSLLTSKNDHGHFRVFSWVDWRAKAFLRFELGDLSPALGLASLIGSFEPKDLDLANVRYQSRKGKAYFASARQALAQDGVKESGGRPKINSETFLKMREIIPAGAQGKAIYGQKNYIIDGPAGTGKSTVVLQKIKLLQAQENVALNKICVVVKSNAIASRFSGLLSHLGLSSVLVCSVKEFVQRFYGAAVPTSNGMDRVRENARRLMEAFLACSDLNRRTSDRAAVLEAIETADSRFQKLIRPFPPLSAAFQTFVFACDKFRHARQLKNEELEQLSQQLAEAHDRLSEKLRAKKISLQELSDERRKLNGEEKSQTDAINLKLTTITKALSTAHEKLESTFFSEDLALSLAHGPLEGGLLALYLNKARQFKEGFHTVVVDEAQDVSLRDIELIYLHSENTVLTGDELQAESPSGIGTWNAIQHLGEAFQTHGQLNIFRLRHNFRQTYELADTSYNFRQSVLGEKFVDTREDYFESQQGFNRPALKLISHPRDFVELVRGKLAYIAEAFTAPIPLVVFYENIRSLERMSSFLDEVSIDYAVDPLDPSSGAVVHFISTGLIAGREFPVVVAPFSQATDANRMYIMMTRAVVDLTLVTGAGRKLSSHLSRLVEASLVSM